MPIGKAAQLQALYDELPTVACRGLCTRACGPVMQSGSLTLLEGDRINRAGMTNPNPPTDPLTCERLDTDLGRCTVYELRPLVCRMYGVVDDERMRCPWGCRLSRWLTNAESWAYLKRAEAIGGVNAMGAAFGQMLSALASRMPQ